MTGDVGRMKNRIANCEYQIRKEVFAYSLYSSLVIHHSSPSYA